MLSHDRDGPSNILFDLGKGMRGVLLLDLRGDVRGGQFVEQLVEAGDRLIGQMHLRFWARWHTTVELFG